MPPFLLSIDSLAANHQVYRYQGASPVALGNPFADVLESPPSSKGASRRLNRVAQFQGGVYAIGVLGVYKLQGDDVTWNNTGGHIFPSPEIATLNGTNNVRSGLHVVYIGDVPHLVGFYLTTTGSTNLRGFKFDGTTWTDFADTNLGAGSFEGQEGGGIREEIVYRNVIHFSTMENAGTLNRMHTWDPATDSYATLTHSVPDDTSNFARCVFDNNLYMVHPSDRTATANWLLSRFEGGTWNVVLTLASDPDFDAGAATDANFHRSRPCLFTDQTSLFALIKGRGASGGDGWRCYQLDAALAPTDITNPVVPPGLRSTDDGGSGSQGDGARFAAFPDVDTAAGILTIYLYHALDGVESTIFTFYEWKGTGLEIVATDSGGDIQHALPFNCATGGERIFSVGEPDIWITGRISATGGERVSFEGASGALGQNVEIYLNLDGEPPTLLATLIGGSALGGAATVVGNQVQTVDLDGTSYSVIVNALASGFTQGQRLQYAARVFP